MNSEFSVKDIERLCGERVLLRRVKVEDVSLGTMTGLFGRDEQFHANAEPLRSGIFLSAPDCEVTRATVVMAGPLCNSLIPGDLVHVPSMLSDGESIPFVPSDDGFEYFILPESSCHNRIEVVDVPISFLD